MAKAYNTIQAKRKPNITPSNSRQRKETKICENAQINKSAENLYQNCYVSEFLCRVLLQFFFFLNVHSFFYYISDCCCCCSCRSWSDLFYLVFHYCYRLFIFCCRLPLLMLLLRFFFRCVCFFLHHSTKQKMKKRKIWHECNTVPSQYVRKSTIAFRYVLSPLVSLSCMGALLFSIAPISSSFFFSFKFCVCMWLSYSFDRSHTC